jgi:hypothetical protein
MKYIININNWIYIEIILFIGIITLLFIGMITFLLFVRIIISNIDLNYKNTLLIHPNIDLNHELAILKQKNIDLNHQIAILTEANNNLNDKLCNQLFTFDIHFNAEIDFEAIKRLMEADNCSRKSMLEEQIIS